MLHKKKQVVKKCFITQWKDYDVRGKQLPMENVHCLPHPLFKIPPTFSKRHNNDRSIQNMRIQKKFYVSI